MRKLAKFTTVFKTKGEIDCISNNRPISILSSIGKTMEKYILNMFIASYYWKNVHRTEFQWGFRPANSSVKQPIRISNDVGKAIDGARYKNTIM